MVGRLSFRVAKPKIKYLPTHVLSTCTKSMEVTRFLYFDLNSKVVGTNIMSTQVTYESNISLHHDSMMLSVLIFYCNLKGKDHIRGKIKSKENVSIWHQYYYFSLPKIRVGNKKFSSLNLSKFNIVVILPLRI